MNILIFAHSSGIGGAERSLLTLVRDLINDYGTNVTVVLPSDGPSVELLQNSGATTLIAPLHMWCTTADIPDPNTISKDQSQSMDWLIEHLDDLRALDPQIVITNTIVIPWGSIAAALLKKPHVWKITEFGELDHGFNFYQPFEEVLRWIENSSDIIITLTNALKDALFPNIQQDKVRTIYLSIDPVEQFVDNQEELLIPSAPKNTTRLVLVGTIRPSKGQQDAVKAVIELVNHRGRQVELVMIGNAEEPFCSELKQLAKDNGVEQNIYILPFREHVLPIFNQADIVLVCSRMEAFGRVTLEGLLSGKPVIGTNTGGTPEIIKNGETGLLYQPGNITQLTDQIEKLMDDPALRETIANNGVKFARSTFIKENFAGKYCQLFQEITMESYQTKAEFSNSLIDLLVKLFAYKHSQSNQPQYNNNELIQEILFYSQSNSWRWTRPLRKLSKLLKLK